MKLKLYQYNDFTHKEEVVKLPKNNATSLEEWCAKFNAKAPAHIQYIVKQEIT